ncbi:MAG: outer membrane lipoprotein-sorting protein [Acidobacteriaceae bacterium]
MRAGLVAGAAMAAAMGLAGPIARAQNLASVLQQMDASAPKFQDVEADINVDNYTAVVQEHETQTGTTAFRRTSHGMEMTMHLLAANGEVATELLYKGGELDYYQPTLKQETIFASGSNRQEWDSLLATGFGASGKELSDAWTVTFQGMEKVGDVPTAKLDLVSKNAKIRENFSHLTIWVDLSRDITLKQVMVQPSGDSRTVVYSDIKYNTRLPDKMFTLKVASGTQVQRR